MKKRIGHLIAGLTLAMVLAGLPRQVIAQYKGQGRAMNAYEMGSRNGYLGFNFTGEYFPFHYFSVAPSVTVFLPPQGKAVGYDLNFRYYLTEKKMQAYVLSGYGAFQTVTESQQPVKTWSHGFNLGAGAMYKFNDVLGINPEIRYQGTRRDEVIFKLGFVYFIN